ncbi:MAG: hypothetical protein ACTSRY_01120 [Alphaproteobacteria bacterium]
MFQGDGRAPLCPVAAVVGDARTVAQYAPGQGRDLTDVTFEAAIGAAVLACEFDKNELTVELRVEVIAQRGPADRSRRGDFEYFVAIADGQHNILAKERFTLSVAFPGNRTRVGVFEKLEQVIYLKQGEAGDSYDIYVGFQLDEGQLRENRARAR